MEKGRPLAQKANYRVPFRRRRDGLTNYRYRDKLLRSGLHRAVVRKSLKSISVQFVEFDPAGDRVVASANALELKKLGWQGSTSNTSAAYFAGLLAGTRAKEKKIGKAVLDIGLQTPSKGSRVFSALKGIIDAGIDVPHGPEILPKDERIKAKVPDFEGFKSKLASHKHHGHEKKTAKKEG